MGQYSLTSLIDAFVGYEQANIVLYLPPFVEVMVK